MLALVARIVVGVGGGIAAFKAVLLVRELQRRGHEVRVVMTRAGARFVGPVTFTGITGRPAVTDLWDPSYAGEVHVELGVWADAMVVAPATMNLLARSAHGFADDAVLATLSCVACPVLFAPAMHHRMWSRPATRRNVERLRGDGAAFVGPVCGPLASGEVGDGRLAEPEDIADALERVLADSETADAKPASDLSGLTVVVSAGPTHEDLDPVRYLGNRSTGRMGYALAEAARARGASVVLVSGPTTLPDPHPAIRRVPVRSALEMKAALEGSLEAGADVVIMAAAVADFRPKDVAAEKIKKSKDAQEGRVLELVRNPDILAELGAARTGSRPLLVGFALETSDVVVRARGKLERKKVDLIVGNLARDGFGKDDNLVTLVDAHSATELPRGTKRELADAILDRVAALIAR